MYVMEHTGMMQVMQNTFKMDNLDHIVKEESLVTCDNKQCEYRGEMFYCYLDNEKQCSIYLEYLDK